MFFFLFLINSPGCGGVRTTTGSVYATDETEYKRLRRTDAQNIRLEAEHERHSMNWTGCGGDDDVTSRPPPLSQLHHHYFPFVLILNCVIISLDVVGAVNTNRPSALVVVEEAGVGRRGSRRARHRRHGDDVGLIGRFIILRREEFTTIYYYYY